MCLLSLLRCLFPCFIFGNCCCSSPTGPLSPCPQPRDGSSVRAAPTMPALQGQRLLPDGWTPSEHRQWRGWFQPRLCPTQSDPGQASQSSGLFPSLDVGGQTNSAWAWSGLEPWAPRCPQVWPRSIPHPQRLHRGPQIPLDNRRDTPLLVLRIWTPLPSPQHPWGHRPCGPQSCILPGRRGAHRLLCTAAKAPKPPTDEGDPAPPRGLTIPPAHGKGLSSSQGNPHMRWGVHGGVTEEGHRGGHGRGHGGRSWGGHRGVTGVRSWGVVAEGRCSLWDRGSAQSCWRETGEQALSTAGHLPSPPSRSTHPGELQNI